jgi:hypothetical protein
MVTFSTSDYNLFQKPVHRERESKIQGCTFAKEIEVEMDSAKLDKG